MSYLWAAQFRSECRADGYREHFCCWPFETGRFGPKLFRTRQECRDWIATHYGYIRRRPDLQREPHCWKPVRPVKVKVKLIVEAI